MTKPVYRYPPFVFGIEAEITDTKRYWLKLKIDHTKKDNIIVILKNPSRATKDVSDKTVFTVTNYIEKNSQRFKCLKNVGSITILNLIPVYETDSSKLRNMPNDLFDEKNTGTIEDVTSKNSTVIIAWGDHSSGLRQEYNELKTSVLNILSKNKNRIFYVDKMSGNGNPKHGQVWSYSDKLKEFKF
jgi:hypothetical protein